jgi:ABC-type spermidine/putrescine transport system permease subunit II
MIVTRNMRMIDGVIESAAVDCGAISIETYE